MERVKGIEPSSSAWKAVALPLSYTREGRVYWDKTVKMASAELDTNGTDGQRENAGPGMVPESIQDETWFLYVMFTGNASMPRSKIGYSCHPAGRRRDLDQGAPFHIKLVRQWPVPASEARRLEQVAHELLDNRRVRGEWFRVGAYVAARAVEQVLRDNGLMTWPTETNLRTGEIKEIKWREFPLP
jgi:Meiotically Up-regulated Gene 113 (MUG113) protein